FERNLRHLKTSDEIKFVLTSKSDYEWARELVKSRKLPTQTVLFSPAQPALQQPGNFEGIDLQWLAEQILKDSLPVRLQVQLHKIIWGPNKPGV
ncbi:MAG: 7-carboxy-7-deazaguanine synthase, partial [Oligoflexia bacterium]